jgi:hypothetical protein
MGDVESREITSGAVGLMLSKVDRGNVLKYERNSCCDASVDVVGDLPTSPGFQPETLPPSDSTFCEKTG